MAEVTQTDLDAVLLRIEEKLGAEDANLVRAEFDRFNREVCLEEMRKRRADLDYEAIYSTA